MTTTGEILQRAEQATREGVPVDWKSMAYQLNDALVAALRAKEDELVAVKGDLLAAPSTHQPLHPLSLDRAGRIMTDKDGMKIRMADRKFPEVPSDG